MPKERRVPMRMGITEKDSKIRIGIVFGGRSGEHEVSITSAASVIGALDPADFEITVIGIKKNGELASASEVCGMLPPQLQARVNPYPALEANVSSFRTMQDPLERVENPHRLPEIIFPLLHGPYGEDGTIQGLLEMANLPYIGCGVLASSVGMDKDVAKRLFLQANLPVPPFRTVLSQDVEGGLRSVKDYLSREFGYPMFSKPANLGSSVGIRKIHSEDEFEESVKYSAQFDRKVLIEKGIDARELECAVLGNDDAQASVVGEIVPANEFYDYEAKYLSEDSELKIPAQISNTKTEEIRNMALQAFKLIDGSGLARVDFFLEHGTGKLYVSEINTMPGFTPISMYAKLWAASGVSFEQLVRRLAQLGMERYQERKKLRISNA
jgi:D-alanine-D-alanine ligase